MSDMWVSFLFLNQNLSAHFGEREYHQRITNNAPKEGIPENGPIVWNHYSNVIEPPRGWAKNRLESFLFVNKTGRRKTGVSCGAGSPPGFPFAATRRCRWTLDQTDAIRPPAKRLGLPPAGWGRQHTSTTTTSRTDTRSTILVTPLDGFWNSFPHPSIHILH